MRTIPPPFLVPVSPYTIQIHGENNQMRLLPLSYSLLLSKKVIKMVYKCDICNYIYDPNNGDPEHGIKAGNDLKDLPSTWVYLVCGIKNDYFYSLKNKKPNYRAKSRISSIVGSIFPQEL